MKRVLVETKGGEGVVVGCALHTQCTCCKSMMRCFYCNFVLRVGVSTCYSPGWYGLVWKFKIPLEGNRTNVYRYVYMVVWRTLCSVCATGARVAQPLPCNS